MYRMCTYKTIKNVLSKKECIKGIIVFKLFLNKFHVDRINTLNTWTCFRAQTHKLSSKVVFALWY